MTKFFLILLVFVIGAIVGISFIIRKLKKIFTIPGAQNSVKSAKEQVIYTKDEVVVLKGEAKKRRE